MRFPWHSQSEQVEELAGTLSKRAIFSYYRRRRKGQLRVMIRGWSRWYIVESVSIEITGPFAQTTLANTCVIGPVVPTRLGGAPGPKSNPSTEASSRPLFVSVTCPSSSTQGRPPGNIPPIVGSTVGPRSGTRAEEKA